MSVLRTVIIKSTHRTSQRIERGRHINTTPMTFRLRTLAIRILINMVRISHLIVNVKLVIRTRPFSYSNFLLIFQILNMTNILFILMILRQRTSFLILIRLMARAALRIVNLNIRTTTLKNILESAIAITIGLVITLHRINKRVPIRNVLTPNNALRNLMNRTFTIRIITYNRTRFTTMNHFLTLIALNSSISSTT